MISIQYFLQEICQTFSGLADNFSLFEAWSKIPEKNSF